MAPEKYTPVHRVRVEQERVIDAEFSELVDQDHEPRTKFFRAI